MYLSSDFGGVNLESVSRRIWLFSTGSGVYAVNNFRMPTVMFGKLSKIDDGGVYVKLDESQLEQLDKQAENTTVELIIADGRRITPDQRKKTFAMFHDISEYTGYSMVETEELMKYRYLAVCCHPKYFSLSDCSVTTANNFLTFIIDFCIKEDIPFKTKVFDEIKGSYQLVRECVLHRKCVICGKHADIDHVKTVGMGRNRRTIDQRGMYVWPVCRKHHQERHTIGIVEFAKKYQLKPIKLDDEIIEKLNLTNEGVSVGK